MSIEQISKSLGPEEKKTVIVLEMGEWDSYNLSWNVF